MIQEQFEELTKIYKQFCKDASETQEMNSNSLSDFIGYIQKLEQYFEDRQLND